MASVDNGKVVRRVETRKEWTSPQLKKFGVEELTAAFHSSTKTDSTSTHS